MDDYPKNWNHENWINFVVKAYKKIDRSYEDIYLNIFSNTSGNKERIFCYELYHQMRIIQEFCEYDLDFVKIEGERDKRDEQQKKFKKIPDFIIHQPRSNNNYLIMEVKKASSTPEDMKKDIKKLKLFMNLSSNGLNYKYGIFLIFGNGDETTLSYSLSDILRNNNIKRLIIDNRLIILWCHGGICKRFSNEGRWEKLRIDELENTQSTFRIDNH